MISAPDLDREPIRPMMPLPPSDLLLDRRWDFDRRGWAVAKGIDVWLILHGQPMKRIHNLLLPLRRKVRRVGQHIELLLERAPECRTALNEAQLFRGGLIPGCRDRRRDMYNDEYGGGNDRNLGQKILQ